MDIFGICPSVIEFIEFKWLLIGIIISVGSLIGMRLPYISMIVSPIARMIVRYAKYLLISFVSLFILATFYKLVFC
ncbi:MAG: hypothetical protein QT11_C0001G0937 [archaeon GW2011_AR20]|nr:MAG: hypothetical protein QT11_C0001G0937 [archaeon GW2011_AR20]MBS3160162.1 hypothetical protein [Candidatus Woesearchaeota archaeon]